MPGTVTTHARPAYYASTLEQTLTGGTDLTGPVLVSEEVAVQLTGAATAVTAQVERSTRDPALGSPNWAPAGDAITGNPSTGIQPRLYAEPGVGWWRVRLTALTGASVVVAISGSGAE